MAIWVKHAAAQLIAQFSSAERPSPRMANMIAGSASSVPPPPPQTVMTFLYQNYVLRRQHVPGDDMPFYEAAVLRIYGDGSVAYNAGMRHGQWWFDDAGLLCVKFHCRADANLVKLHRFQKIQVTGTWLRIVSDEYQHVVLIQKE